MIYGLNQNHEHTSDTHFISENNGFLYLWPEEFSSETISPKSFCRLKDKYFISNVTIFDRIKGVNKNMWIKDHINRSGFNFLSGKTPFKNFPMFPDVSKIYQPIKGLNGVIVHTVGPKRFRESGDNKAIISESVALVAPIWYYIGVRVSAKGIPYN